MKPEKATRKSIPLIACLYGKAGGGKTYSAIRLATGLVNGDKICLIDTENGRASHYADEFDNLYVINLDPPFTPNRYIEAIKSAQNENFKVIIIDSITHEWDGIGGCIDMADSIGKNTNLKSMGVWIEPKNQHKKLMATIARSDAHIIFCARAKEEYEESINHETKRKQIICTGIIPVQERNFPYEMLLTFFVEDGGQASIKKCIGSLKQYIDFKDGKQINENDGEKIREWLDKGQKVNSEAIALKEEARDIAMMEGEEALKTWFSNLLHENKKIATQFSNEFKKELCRIARDRDALEGRTTPDQSIKINPPVPLELPEIKIDQLQKNDKTEEEPLIDNNS